MKNNIVIFECCQKANDKGELKTGISITTDSGIFNIYAPHGSDLSVDNGSQTMNFDLGQILQCDDLDGIRSYDIDITTEPLPPIKKKKSKKLKAQIKILEEIKELMRLDCPDQHSIIVEEKISELKGE